LPLEYVSEGAHLLPRRKTAAAADTKPFGMDRDQQPANAGVERVLLLVAGSVSVGIHAALAPEHLHEWLPLGAAFVLAAVAGAAAVTAFIVRPASRRPSRALGLLLAALVASYAATRLVALPPLDPEREQPDSIGVFTTAAEAAGLIFALRLGWRRPMTGRLRLISQGGTP
jgi:membrane associated rhomboid family serine protease